MITTSEHSKWLAVFNPCVVSPIQGYVLSPCTPHACQPGPVECLKYQAFSSARLIINDNLPENLLRREFSRFFKKMSLGREAVNLTGQRIEVTPENVSELINLTIEDGKQIANEIDFCVKTTGSFNTEVQMPVTLDQRQALLAWGALVEKSTNFTGNLSSARRLEKQRRMAIETLLDSGIEDVNMFAQEAIVLGLENRVIQSTTAHMFNRNNCGPLKRVPK